MTLPGTSELFSANTTSSSLPVADVTVGGGVFACASAAPLPGDRPAARARRVSRKSAYLVRRP